MKTLSDPGAKAVNLTPHLSSVAKLGRLPVSRGGQTTRSAAERVSYVVTATVAGIRHESDGDVHLILSDGGARMIAESPTPSCVASSWARALLAPARAAVDRLRIGQRVRIAGVLFFDFAHGQSGHALNYVELHPVLRVS